VAMGSSRRWNNLDSIKRGSQSRRSYPGASEHMEARNFRLNSSSGSMSIEAAIIIPVLILLCGGILSLGMRLSNYMYLNQIGKELVLQMGTVRCLAHFSSSSLPSSYSFTLGPQSFSPTPPNETTVSSCLTAIQSDCSAVASGCPLNVLNFYAATLVKSKPIRVEGNITMDYSFDPPASDPSSGVCLLTVRFTAQDPTWIGYLGGPLTTITQGPYLSTPMPAAGSGCLM
jgi:hypothetical protein